MQLRGSKNKFAMFNLIFNYKIKFHHQLPANQYLNELFRCHFNGLFKLLISSVI